MDITPLISASSKVIQSYRQGRFRVSGDIFESAVIVFPDRVIDWPLQNLEKPSVEDFDILAREEERPDVLLFGCGVQSVFFPPSFKNALKQKGLVIEVMDTGAACRTYNVLMAEGRRVAAALLPVTD